MARKPEQLVWDALWASCGSEMLLQRHEDSLSCGIPDVSGVIYRREFWCELKASRGLGALKLRQRQLNWMYARQRRGVDCFLLARRDPDEWAGCLMYHGNWLVLSENIKSTNFADLAQLGDSDSSPSVLIKRNLSHCVKFEPA